MVHICNFCLGKVFDNNVFLMFSRFGDDITIYVLYDGISDNCSCRGPSIKDVRTLGGEGGQEKAEKCGHGKGVVSQMWKSAWKKIIATIFVKFTQINDQPNVNRPGQGEGVPKISKKKFVRASFMDDP